MSPPTLKILVQPTEVQRTEDVIAVHGIWDDRMPSWTQDKQGNNGWLQDRYFSSSPRSRIFSFEYDAQSIRESDCPAKLLDDVATELLAKLAAARSEDALDDPVRILFWGHDIGGTIIKKALLQASVTEAYYPIYLSVKLLGFIGCPHRCRSLDDLEGAIIRLFSFATLPRDFLARSKALAKVINGTNDLFEDIKMLQRTPILSISNDDNLQDAVCDDEVTFNGMNAPYIVFDGQMSTFGSTTELRIMVPLPHFQLARLKAHAVGNAFPLMESLAHAAGTDESNSDSRFSIFLKTPWCLLFTSIAPPLQVPRIITDAELPRALQKPIEEKLAEWSIQPKQRVLCILGNSGQSFLAPDFVVSWFQDSLRGTTFPTVNLIWFKFDARDGQHNTISSLLGSLIAQLWTHDAEANKKFQENLDQRWWFMTCTDEDLWRMFLEDLRGLHPLSRVTFVIGNLDQCRIGAAWFLERLVRLLSRFDRPIRFVITLSSHQSPMALPEEWQKLELPDLNVASERPSMRHLGSLELDLHPSARNILDLALFSGRPLTVWEMADALAVTPATLTREIDRWLNCAVSIDHHRVVPSRNLTEDDLQMLLIDDPNNTAEDNPPWYKTTPAAAHARIAEICLRFLRRSEGRRVPDIGEALLFVSLDPDRSNFRSYSVQYWPFHFREACRDKGKDNPLAKSMVGLCSQLAGDPSQLGAFWQDFWLQSNPLRRAQCFPVEFLNDNRTLAQPPQRLLLDPIPIFAGLGLLPIVDALIRERKVSGAYQAALDNALEAAAQFGHMDVSALLELYEPTPSRLLQAALCAANGGHEDTLKALMQADAPPKYQNLRDQDFLRRLSFLGLYERVDDLLEAQLEPEDKTDNMCTPLLLAAAGGYSKVVATLAEHGATVDCIDKEGYTALSVACADSGDIDTIIYLVEKQASLESKSKIGWTPLMAACRAGNHAAVQYLLKNGAKTQPDTESKWSPLALAALSGSEICLQHLLNPGPDKQGANLNCRGPEGPAIVYAAFQDDPSLCQMLLSKNAVADLAKDEVGITPLMAAALFGNLESINALLKVEPKVSLETEDAIGDTALMVATKTSHTDVAKALIESQANVSHNNKDGEFPLLVAASTDNVELAEALIRHNADVDHYTEPARLTALHIAATSSKAHRVLSLLLEKGADPNIRIPHQDTTPLMLACENGVWKAVKELLSFGAHPNASLIEPDTDDAEKGIISEHSPLLISVREGHHGTARLLLEAGADINYTPPGSFSAVEIALLHNDESMLHLLLEFQPQLNAQDLKPGEQGRCLLGMVDERTPLPMVRMLVNRGASTNPRNPTSIHPLLRAAWADRVDVVEYLLSRGADIHTCRRNEGTALQVASRSAGLKLVEFLTSHEADVNFPGAELWHATPLQSACLGISAGAEPESLFSATSRLQIIKHLLEKGAIVNKNSGNYGTAANIACWRCPLEVVSLLLDHGARLGTRESESPEKDTRDRVGRSAIHFACLNSVAHFDLVRRKAEHDVQTVDKMGLSVLHWAVIGGKPDIVAEILKSETVPVDARDGDGWTPLMWAARVCGRAYLFRPESQHMTDEEFVCALDKRRAETIKSLAEIKDLLLQAGADTKLEGSCYGRKWSAAKVALYYGHEGFITAQGQEESEAAEEEESKTAEIKEEAQRALKLEDDWRGCDACFLDVYGCYYHCDECLDFDLCFKCFGHVGKIHPSHKFSQVGTALASQAPIEMTRKLIEPEIPLAPLGASANGYGAPEVADLSASESVVVGRA